jgi:O-antigen/teichoic acid export membrane protein
MNANRTPVFDRLPTAWQACVHRLRQHAARRSFTWNVSIMLLGTMAWQVFSILLSPVLTRLFTPEQFGYLSVYNAVLMMFGVIASLGLEMAIPICLVDAECANLLALCGIALSGTTTACALIATVVPADMLTQLGIGQLASYRYLLPLGVAWLGGYYIMVAVATRAAAFKEIARTRISQGISGPVSQIILGILNAGAPGLVIGFIIGQASGTLLLLSRTVLSRPAWLRQVTWSGMVAVARRYAGFPLYATWARVLDIAGGATILFVLFSACYSTEVAGFMFLSERVIMRPLIVLSTSLLQVFTGEAGRVVSEDPAQLLRRFRQVVPRQFLVATVWILIANLLAGWAFPLLFGPAWADAVPYLRALSVFYLLQAILHPVSTTLQTLERQVTALAWQIGRALVVVPGVLLPWWSGMSALTTLWISAVVQAACCLVLLWLMAGAIRETVARRCTVADR